MTAPDGSYVPHSSSRKEIENGAWEALSVRYRSGDVEAPTAPEATGYVSIPYPTEGGGGTGSVGATGPKGATGPSGPSGPAGITGPSGPSGPAGATGPSGPSGATGPSGTAGPASTVPGPTGPSGPSGTAGTVGATGPSGAAGADYSQRLYRWRTATTAVDPGVGAIQANQTDPAAATQLYISENDANNAGFIRLASLKVGDNLDLYEAGNIDTHIRFAISATPTDNGSWWTVPVSLVDDFTLPFAPNNNEDVFVAAMVAAPPGPSGPAGASGPPGASGPAGIAGPSGPAGTGGASGPAGASGPSGPTGLQGVQGIQGTSGISGVVHRGLWSNTTDYVANDAVTYNGSAYVTTGTEVVGTPPTSDGGVTTNPGWALFVAEGAQGVQGIAGLPGPSGPTGATGPAGTAGTAGATGPVGPSTVADSVFTLQNVSDITKQARFSLSQLTPGTMRIFTLPDTPGTVVLDNSTQTLTNKTSADLRVPISTKAANYTLTAADSVIRANGGITVTLPSAVVAGAGRRYDVKNIDTTNAVTINSAAGAIEGVATLVLAAKESVTLISDGAVWTAI